MKLQELICTKFNHDLIGNVGAICNAVELLEEGDLDFLDDIKEVLKVSSFKISSRLKFFRVVYGSSGIIMDGIVDTIQNYVDSVSLRNYPITTNIASLEQKSLKQVMLLIMIVAELMIKGGLIFVENNAIRIEGNKFNKDKVEFLKDLNNVPEAAANAAVLYLRELLSLSGSSLKISQKDDMVLTIEVI